MSFYVTLSELSRLSGRSLSGLALTRTDGKLPYEMSDDGSKKVYDIDNPQVQKWIFKPLPSLTAEKIKEIELYREQFMRRKQEGKEKCAKTGEIDFMSAMEEGTSFAETLRATSDVELDRLKKEKEVEKLSKTIDKLDITVNKERGTTIDRDYVRAWVSQYVGLVHKQVLNYASSGICDDLFNLSLENKDSPREAVKVLERFLAEGMSDSLKQAKKSMEEARL